MATSSARLTPLSFAVLGVLSGESLHAYGIRKRLEAFGKGRVVRLGQRANTYQAIGRLQSLGLVRVVGTAREGPRPQQTIYTITDAGRAAMTEWLREALAEPQDDAGEFAVALSYAGLLSPPELADLLRHRRALVIEHARDAHRAVRAGSRLPAVLTLDEAYKESLARCELRWLDRLLAALDDGDLSWKTAELDRLAREVDAAGGR